jgi:arylsulfatase A-like enzyme
VLSDQIDPGSLPKFVPLQSGYDHFYGFREGGSDYYDHDTNLWDDDVQVHEMGYLTDLLGGRAVDVVNGYAKSGRPSLLSLHFNAPHWPWEAPGDEAESNRLRLSGGGLRSQFDFDGGSQKTYQRIIQTMDLQVGRVVQALNANGLAENTIVIFTSDNGGERFADIWPFIGRKTELLEGGLRIPLIISWPARIPQARTTEQVSISMDWLPTLLAAAGASSDPAFPPDGTNLLPMLTQNATPVERKLFWAIRPMHSAPRESATINILASSGEFVGDLSGQRGFWRGKRCSFRQVESRERCRDSSDSMA